jgi:diguanylate cyclase (GGDEF)-like protein
VEKSGGRLVVANETGALLRLPLDACAPVVTRTATGAIIQTTRHDLPSGGTVLIGTDVTENRAARARIAFLTDHDPLTGLPNRWHAASRIQELVAGKSGSDRVAALVLFDLDGFQDINDTMGHEGGDEVLVEVAGRLRDLVADHDVVARLGGDEFLIFLDNPEDEAAIMDLARQIPRALARPIAVRGQQIRLGTSLGIALYPRDGGDATTLFRHADIALSRAKRGGRGTAQSFVPEMMVSFEEHRLMESDLRRALDSDELELRLQPQFACATLEVTGFEALTRWRHPTRGELSPTFFIPIAERSGLINPLGLWAIEEACKAAASWRTRHRVAVNLSPSQLRCETIQEDIRGILRRTQFPAHLLELEVTESVLLDEDQRSLETLHKLRAMDIRVTLDDFGTGYSSLSYLRRFPFDKIKIDKSFIQGQGSDRGTRVILDAMIRMCTDLGFDVVAEGVETEHQLNELRALGCREVQGFLLGEPLLPAMVEEFLLTRGRGTGRILNTASS